MRELLNLSIDFAGIVICVLGMVLVSVNARIDRSTGQHFRLLYLFLILLAASNAAGQLMRGLPGPGWRAALYVSNFTEFFCPTVLAVILTRYFLSLMDPKREFRFVRRAADVLLALDFVLLFASQFTGLLLVIGEDNVCSTD